MTREECKRFLGVEFRHAFGDHANAVKQRGQQHVHQAAGPGPIRRRPHPIAGLRKELMRKLDAGKVAEQNPMRVEHALGIAGRAGSVDDDRGIFGPRFDNCVVRRGPRDQIRPVEHGAVASILDRNQYRRRFQVLAQHRAASRCPARSRRRPLPAVNQAIFDRLRAKQGEHRQGDCAEPIGCEMRDHCLPDIAATGCRSGRPANAVRRQRIGEPARLLLKLLESHLRDAGAGLEHERGLV